jgi:cytochrome c553
MSHLIGPRTLGLLLVAYAAGSHGADASAGKTLTQTKCPECHEPADWQGESADSLEAMIKDVVAGKTKHQITLKLSDAEIADIAAYWSTAAAGSK